MIQLDDETTLVSTFFLGEAMFGIETQAVQEVVPLGRLTPVHQAPAYISGIINLRGQIVTVMDLAHKLNMMVDSARSAWHILIVIWQGEHIGLKVDSVADVVSADIENLQPLPANIRLADQKFFKGVCQAGQNLVAVLDLDMVLVEEEYEITSPGSR